MDWLATNRAAMLPLRVAAHLLLLAPNRMEVAYEPTGYSLPRVLHRVLAALGRRDRQRAAHGPAEVLVERPNSGIANDVQRPRHGIRGHRHATGHRLKNDQPERVRAAGEYEHVRGCVVLGQLLPALLAEEVHIRKGGF